MAAVDRPSLRPPSAALQALLLVAAAALSGFTIRRGYGPHDEGLMLAFIIEELPDGRYTLFVPSIPTPLAGAVYVVERIKVHPLDIPFTEALKTISRWGSGSKDLVAAMERGQKASA